jgi:hypothetical protein
MADEQDRAERLDDEKFDDVFEKEPPIPLVDNTADIGDGATTDLDEGETGDELEGILGEADDDPAPDFYGAGVPAEEAAMHIEEG